MYVDNFIGDNCTVYILAMEKGEHDHQLEWPIPEMKVELSDTENTILYRATICTRCGYTVNQIEGGRTNQLAITPTHAHVNIGLQSLQQETPCS